jgi:predicted ABC-type exoprotein transport system permease subunit
VAGVWVLAAAAGLGFYYWWYTALVKTLPVFGILLFLVVCMVASLLVSMVPNRPQITALALALMAAPLASMAAAAVLHGAYYFEWIARPIIG